MRGMWGCADLRGAVNPYVPGICYFIGKSGSCCAVRSGGRGLCRGWPGSARAPLGHRVPGGRAGAGASLCNNWLLGNGL